MATADSNRPVACVLRFLSCEVLHVGSSCLLRIPPLQAARRLIPLLDRVLVKRVDRPAKSIGGVLLPDSVVEKKLNEGIVLACGPGRRDKDGTLLPMGVKPDDKVLLPQYGGSEITIEDEDLVLYRDEDILGILKE